MLDVLYYQEKSIFSKKPPIGGSAASNTLVRIWVCFVSLTDLLVVVVVLLPASDRE
jgi:hypothetical protein